jgi:DNA primase
MDGLFERVKAAVGIADVAERFGGLKLDRSGKACCPFHSEKTPSFSVKKSDNIFKCFGCGESGDAIDFVAKLKGIESLDAAKLIAEAFGISA